MKTVVTICLALALTACGTAYQAKGFTGGFTETQLQDNVYRVAFSGNGATKPDQAEDMALLRSAELMLEKGYPHFVIIDERSRVDTAVVNTPGQATTTGTINTYGNTAYLNARTTYTGGSTLVVRKPTTTNTIMGFKEKPVVNGLVYDSKLVYESLAPKYIKK